MPDKSTDDRFLNGKPFEHLCSHGTVFTGDCCAFSKPVKVREIPTSLAGFAKDMAEFAAWHALNIFEQLNGFQGYDCIPFDLPAGDLEFRIGT